MNIFYDGGVSGGDAGGNHGERYDPTNNTVGDSGHIVAVRVDRGYSCAVFGNRRWRQQDNRDERKNLSDDHRTGHGSVAAAPGVAVIIAFISEESAVAGRRIVGDSGDDMGRRNGVGDSSGKGSIAGFDRDVLCNGSAWHQ